MLLILIIVLLVLALGGLPSFGFHHFGYGPSGVLFTILIIVVVLMLLGRL